MAREAKLFSSSAGSAVRGFLKFRANILPRWIRNARTSRKLIEPEIAGALLTFKRLRKTRPRAHATIRNARKDLRAALSRWETSYAKENFYRGIRILLEREGLCRTWICPNEDHPSNLTFRASKENRVLLIH